MGLTASILIGLFVWDEYEYDKFIPNAEQIYRIYDEYINHDATQTLGVASPMYAVTMKQYFAEVQNMV